MASIKSSQIYIGELMGGTGSYQVSYFVQAVRSDGVDVPVVASMDAIRRPGGLIRDLGGVEAADKPRKRRDSTVSPARPAASAPR